MKKMMHSADISRPELQPASITIGIDVSKDYLDAAHYPGEETTRVPNTRKGQTALLRWMGDLTMVARIVFEPTGPYHRTMKERLTSLGTPPDQSQPAAGTALCRGDGQAGQDRSRRCPDAGALWRLAEAGAAPDPLGSAKRSG